MEVLIFPKAPNAAKPHQPALTKLRWNKVPQHGCCGSTVEAGDYKDVGGRAMQEQLPKRRIYAGCRGGVI